MRQVTATYNESDLQVVTVDGKSFVRKVAYDALQRDRNEWRQAALDTLAAVRANNERYKELERTVQGKLTRTAAQMVAEEHEALGLVSRKMTDDS